MSGEIIEFSKTETPNKGINKSVRANMIRVLDLMELLTHKKDLGNLISVTYTHIYGDQVTWTDHGLGTPEAALERLVEDPNVGEQHWIGPDASEQYRKLRD